MGSFLMILTVFLLNCLSLFRVADVSMEPVLSEGDLILVLHTDRIGKGDIVVFASPDGYTAVKSCVLVEGEKLVVQENYLMAGDRSWFLQPDQKERLLLHDTVPEGSYVLLGENSFHSRDSREWGFIEKDDILGKVIGIKGNCIE